MRNRFLVPERIATVVILVAILLVIAIIWQKNQSGGLELDTYITCVCGNRLDVESLRKAGVVTGRCSKCGARFGTVPPKADVRK